MEEKYWLLLHLYLTVFTLLLLWARTRLGRLARVRDGQLAWVLPVGLLAALVIRLYMADEVTGFDTDVATFKSWAVTAADNLPGFYDNVSFCDYPPLYVYVLALVGSQLQFPDLMGFNNVLIKLPAIVADLGLALVVQRLAKKRVDGGVALLLALIVAFNPASILDSAIWGQVDSIFALMMLLALLSLMKPNMAVSGCLFSLAMLLKPQAIFFMPILLFELIRRRKAMDWLMAGGAGLLTAAAVSLPFSRDPLFLVRLYLGTAGGYEYASLNAFNLFSLLGVNLAKDSLVGLILPHSAWGLIFDLALVVWVGWMHVRSPMESRTIASAVLMGVGAYMVSVRMHERYLYPVIVLLPVLYLFERNRRILDLLLLFSVTITVGVHDVLYREMTLKYPHLSADDRLLFLLSMMNLIGFVVLALVLRAHLAGRRSTLLSPADGAAPHSAHGGTAR